MGSVEKVNFACFNDVPAASQRSKQARLSTMPRHLQKFNNQRFQTKPMADKKELLQKSYALKSETSKLKHEIHSLNSRKKNLYARLDKLRAEFRPLIEKVKGLRAKRDEHTASVKELKTKRQSASSVAKNAIVDLEKFREEKERKSKALGVRKSASSIAEEIRKLEFKIETEALPFEHEKKLSKLVKEKKAELEKANQLTGIVTQLKSSFDKLHASKSDSDKAHQELQLHASVSQKLHEDMLSHAKKADEIKAEMKPLEKEKADIATRYSELKSELEKKLSELDSLNGELDKIKAEQEKERELEEERIIAEKEKELTEKIKSGKKLTRDDLIMLQKSG